ncbi:hypothetical protein ACIQXZ_29490 [Bacillus thuringiensis]|uniref:hypothetical protein n=1 Tax=Bacillus thuringiensis TaxID=1428 RepID=UPI00380EA3E6
MKKYFGFISYLLITLILFNFTCIHLKYLSYLGVPIAIVLSIMSPKRIGKFLSIGGLMLLAIVLILLIDIEVF